MKKYEIRFTKEAIKNIRRLNDRETGKLQDILLKQVAQNPKSGKRLVGDLKGYFSICLSYRNRIVYSIDDEKNIIYVHRAGTHYGD
ncbi:MAG: type II toxin-antitoxin system RelE/ParE family toxin [Candidatus Aegiribacteria sp.]|nr:type II toxin-antitoxin system RelE/ParE family toxin [Candidatus Aegiribacteria sp.]